MRTIKPEDVFGVLLDTNGRFFTVCFTKRTTGEQRVMNATLNFRSLLKGGQAAYDHNAEGLIVVRDEAKDAIRSIPVENVLWIRANGETFEVRHG